MSFLDNIKSVPITDFAERIGFHTARCGSKYVTLKEHDSVRIDSYKNCFWRNSRFSQGVKGAAGSIIDFAIEFNGASDPKEAIRQIADMYGINAKENIEPKSINTKTKLKKYEYDQNKLIGSIDYPEHDNNNEAVVEYLSKERGISRTVIRYFFNKKMIYQDKKKNCVFYTKDFCCLRSTGKLRFVQDRKGCNYNECFYFEGRKGNNTLIVAESVIDIMSIMTDICNKNERFINYNYLALSGTNKLMSVRYHVEKNPNIKKIILCYDNDQAGEDAIRSTKTSLEDKNVIIEIKQAPVGKDWNEYIKSVMAV